MGECRNSHVLVGDRELVVTVDPRAVADDGLIDVVHTNISHRTGDAHVAGLCRAARPGVEKAGVDTELAAEDVAQTCFPVVDVTALADEVDRVERLKRRLEQRVFHRG